MSDKTHRVLGIGGAIAVAIGTAAMIVSGADIAQVSGIVGLGAAALTAALALYNGIAK